MKRPVTRQGEQRRQVLYVAVVAAHRTDTPFTAATAASLLAVTTTAARTHLTALVQAGLVEQHNQMARVATNAASPEVAWTQTYVPVDADADVTYTAPPAVEPDEPALYSPAVQTWIHQDPKNHR